MLSIRDIHDRHAGKIGFVVGAGPSLRFADLDVLRRGVVFAVNSALPKVPFTQYFVADDIGVKHWNYFRDVLPKLDTVALLYEDKLRNEAYHLDPKKVLWFKHTWWNDGATGNKNPDGLILHRDPDRPIVGARTSAGSAVHLAHIAGCSPIVLVGCDCCYEGRRRYYWQFEGETPCYRVTGEPVFSHPNRGMMRGKPVDSHSVSFIEYWKAMAEHPLNADVKILDASDGLLNCFPKVKLSDLELM